MSLVLSAVAFLFLMTVLVLLHELGHFVAAKKAGVIVEEFGFGLPPRARTLFVRHGTRFSLNWIPFGGFVRLKGENALEEHERVSRGSFGSASIFARIVILTAGVFMNFLFAIIIFTSGFWLGHWIPTYVSFADMQAANARGEISMQPAVLIEDVTSDGSAASVGIPKSALLLRVDGTAVSDPAEVTPLQEGKKKVTYDVLLAPDYKEEQQFVVPLVDGKTGVALRVYLRSLTAPKRSLPGAFVLSLREAKVMTVQTTIGLVKLFRSLASSGRIPEGITGIVGIAQMTHASVQEGFSTYLRLVALLSLSLAILNILPLPALDGGRLLFVLVEAVVRRPVNRRFELTTNALGFAFLILLILLITYHDILRLF
jgi:regulator of sigma E protease